MVGERENRTDCGEYRLRSGAQMCTELAVGFGLFMLSDNIYLRRCQRISPSLGDGVTRGRWRRYDIGKELRDCRYQEGLFLEV